MRSGPITPAWLSRGLVPAFLPTLDDDRISTPSTRQFPQVAQYERQVGMTVPAARLEHRYTLQVIEKAIELNDGRSVEGAPDRAKKLLLKMQYRVGKK